MLDCCTRALVRCVGGAETLAVEEAERVRAFSSVLLFRILVLFSSSCTYLSWASTFAATKAATLAITDLLVNTSVIDRWSAGGVAQANASICTALDEFVRVHHVRRSHAGIAWAVAAVHFLVFVLISTFVIWRFSSALTKAASAPNSGEGSKEQRSRALEAKFRSVGVSNVLSSLAGVVVLALRAALLSSFPSTAAAWQFALVILFIGAGSATALDVMGHAQAKVCCPTNTDGQRKRCTKIAEVWNSGFAWSTAAFTNEAVDQLLLVVLPTDCTAEGGWAGVGRLWAAFGVGLLLALVGFQVMSSTRDSKCCVLRRGSHSAQVVADRGGSLEMLVDVGDAIVGLGEDLIDGLSTKLGDLSRKTLVWLPTIAFDEAMRASLAAFSEGEASFGSALYAAIVTVLAAALAIFIESHVRRCVRAAAEAAKAGGDGDQRAVALAHNFANIMSNALGVIVGYAWGRLLTMHLGHAPAHQVAFAGVSTLVAVCVALWLADVFPRRQAALIAFPEEERDGRTLAKPVKQRQKQNKGAPPEIQVGASEPERAEGQGEIAIMTAAV
jgi:hypothetical protein